MQLFYPPPPSLQAPLHLNLNPNPASLPPACSLKSAVFLNLNLNLHLFPIFYLPRSSSSSGRALPAYDTHPPCRISAAVANQLSHHEFGSAPKLSRRQPEEGLTVAWRKPNVSSDVRSDHFGPNRNPPHGASALRSSSAQRTRSEGGPGDSKP